MKLKRAVYDQYITTNQSENLLLGKTILVIGAGSGIGRSIGINLIKAGATVIFSGRNQANLEETIKQAGDGAIEICDINSRLEIENLFQRLHKNQGNLPDVIINSAGIRLESDKMDDPLLVTEDEWDLVFNTNFTSNMLCASIYHKNLENSFRSPRGRYISVTSIDGLEPAATSYGLSKACLNMYIQKSVSVFREMEIFAIAPGPTATAMMNKDLKFKYYRRDHADMRCAIPQDIANLAVFMCSDYFSANNGSVLVCDGGKTL